MKHCAINRNKAKKELSGSKQFKDSELSYAHRESYLIDVVDRQWRKDQLPHDDILIPERELPPSDDTDNIDISETLKEQEEKWMDLGLQNLQESPRHN